MHKTQIIPLPQLIYACFLMLLFSCTFGTSKNTSTAAAEEIHSAIVQNILDSAQLQGSILIYDVFKNAYYSNDFNWCKKGFLPASTFKIPNTIIGLETGVISDQQMVFPWDGRTRSINNWNQDLILRDAFQFSCVPCYQEVARQVGLSRMQLWLDKLNYGHMQLDSSTLDIFWLQGDSRISSFEQIDFLQRLYNSSLDIQARTENIVKNILRLEQGPDYQLSGKTGWAIVEQRNMGWFVGYLEKGDQLYYFASNVEPKNEFDMHRFAVIRKQVTLASFAALGIAEIEENK